MSSAMLPPAWVIAVTVSCSVSCFTVVGFVLQSAALRDEKQRERYPKVGELVMSPLWLLGAVLQIVPNFAGDLVAYMLAPLSLTAPLSGVSVAVNTSLAPRLLGERLHRWPDLPATALILLGVVLTTSTGAHQDNVTVPGLAALQELASRPMSMVSFTFLAASLAACIIRQLHQRRAIEEEAGQRFEAPKLSNLLLPAWCAAGAGCFTNVGLKAVGELMDARASNAALFTAVAVGVVPAALVQQQALNNGLRLYPQTVFFPIYSSLLVLTNTIFGAIFFQEYLALNEARNGPLFALGLALVMGGIGLFSLRTIQHAVENPSGLSETLL